MARTKQTSRKSGLPPRERMCRGDGKPKCFDLRRGGRCIPTPRNGRHSQLPKSHTRDDDTASSRVTANFYRDDDEFPQFARLPREIQKLVWEMLATEPRVVPVSINLNGRGLRSPIPPILHACPESRTVGLKHYVPSFAAQQTTYIHPIGTRKCRRSVEGSPRVYFNFARDVLYFREDWNEGVKGQASCFEELRRVVKQSDVKKVRRVGMDVNARACSLRTSGETCHSPSFAYWDALEILYIGYEDEGRLGADCPIRFDELERKDYKDFMNKYKRNPCWEVVRQDGEEAVEHLRNEVPYGYHGRPLECFPGYWDYPEGFLEKLEVVRIKHL